MNYVAIKNSSAAKKYLDTVKFVLTITSKNGPKVFGLNIYFNNNTASLNGDQEWQINTSLTVFFNK